MKLFYKPWGLVGALLCLGLASSAFGQGTTGKLDITGLSGSLFGENTSPYTGTFTPTGGSALNITFICDDLGATVSEGTSYDYTSYSLQYALDNNLVKFPAESTDTKVQTYEAVAFLAANLSSSSLLGQTGLTTPEVAFAIWYIFDPSEVNTLASVDPTTRAIIQNLASTALADAENSSGPNTIPNDLADFTVYEPAGCTAGNGDNGCTVGQEFLSLTSTTPEASSPVILAVDMLALAGIVLLFRRRASRAA